MCGIAGMFSSRDARSDVAAMTEALNHRGPDDSGIAELRGTSSAVHGCFGHRRLSIVDLSPAGHQPMWTPDNRYCITYNGEIYNYAPLRAGLESDGVEFRGHSDTEVLLRGWEREGPEWLKKLRGMFALAIWDGAAERGWLVRDAFGIKPLYVFAAGGEVSFASEVKAIVAGGRVARKLSAPGLASFLAAGSVTEPFTIVDGITAVPPGHVVQVERDGKAWSIGSSRHVLPAFREHYETFDRATHVRNIRDALNESVAQHLVADVDVGVFLSGGIDSAVVAGLAADATATAIDSFTVTFDEKEFSEGDAAADAARRFGTRHHAVPLPENDLLDSLPAFFSAMDQPSLDGLNTFVVSRAVKSFGLKVVLSGLGGDELFAGYPSFSRAKRLAPLWSLPGTIRAGAAFATGVMPGARTARIAAALRGSTASRAAYEASRTLFTAEQAGRLLPGTPGHLPRSRHDSTLSHRDGLSLMQQVSVHEATGYMLDTLLRDSDVFSMSHGLELRVPLVDARVAAAAMAAAGTDSSEWSRGPKPFLVDAVRDLLSPGILARPKQGFTLPFEKWMRSQLAPGVGAVLTAPEIATTGLSPAAARDVWDDFQRRRPGMNWSRPWALYTLARWTRENGFSL